MHPQGKKWGCTCTPCPPCSYPSASASTLVVLHALHYASGVSRLGKLAGPQEGPGVCSTTGPEGAIFGWKISEIVSGCNLGSESSTSYRQT